MIELDEGLARSSTVGRVIHQVIAELAQRTRDPTVEEIKAAVSARLSDFAPIEARSHRQNIVAGAAVYFRRFRLPDTWHFIGAETQLGAGRVDLLWSHQRGDVILDEIKTGQPRQLHLTATRQQVHRYLTESLDRWGYAVRGIRLLSTQDPGQSLFVTPDGATTALSITF